jgi:hypothetical protein
MFRISAARSSNTFSATLYLRIYGYFARLYLSSAPGPLAIFSLARPSTNLRPPAQKHIEKKTPQRKKAPSRKNKAAANACGAQMGGRSVDKAAAGMESRRSHWKDGRYG